MTLFTFIISEAFLNRKSRRVHNFRSYNFSSSYLYFQPFIIMSFLDIPQMNNIKYNQSSLFEVRPNGYNLDYQYVMINEIVFSQHILMMISF